MVNCLELYLSKIIEFVKLDVFTVLFYFSNLDRAVLDTIRNLSLKNEPTKKSSSEYIDTVAKKPLLNKKPKQIVPDHHHSGTNIARTLLSIFGMI